MHPQPSLAGSNFPSQPPAKVGIHELFQANVLGNYARQALVPQRGEGAWLWDQQGNQYLDMGGGIAVTGLGHAHPVVVQTLKTQAKLLWHTSNLYTVSQQATLAALINREVTQLPGKVFFCNSGTEANEALIKLARRFGSFTPNADGEARYEIITFSHSFHGRTYGGLSATAQPKMHAGCGPMLPGFVYVPFNDPAALEEAITPLTVAILLEPLQGEGGIYPATPEFLQKADVLRQKHDLLLMFDEVQCGLGRLGDLAGWRAIQAEQDHVVQPDAVSWAKSLGGGFPIGASWIADRPLHLPDHPEIQTLPQVLSPGTHGSTYGGNPLACAVSEAVLRVIVDEKLPAHAKALGAEILDTVRSWNTPFLVDSRGQGFMLGFEIASPEVLRALPEFTESGLSPSGFVVKRLMEEGLLAVPSGTQIVRWLPPLNLTREESAHALRLLAKVLKVVPS